MSSVGIYHERQVRELCALHALNNLFQSRDAYKKEELDSICYSLSPDVWINPHKSMLGLGNYDINVLMKALQSRECEAVWFDKRKDPSCLNFENIFGFILNVPSEYKLSFITLPLRRRHWVTLRQINGTYYNLDSKLDVPHIIGRVFFQTNISNQIIYSLFQCSDLIEYLKQEIDHKDKQLFLVVTAEVGKNQAWLLHQESYSNNLQEREAEVLQLKDIISDGVNVTINPLCNVNVND